MKTLQEIKDQVAQEHGFDDWEHAASRSFRYVCNLVDEVIQSYALAVTLEDRKDAAEKACLEDITPIGNYEGRWQVDKSSITDRPLPELK